MRGFGYGCIIASLSLIWSAAALSSPTEFACTAETSLAWETELQHNYSRQYRSLSRSIEKSMDLYTFGNQGDYYSTIVNDFWEVNNGNVRISFRVFFSGNTSVTAEEVRKFLEDASSKGSLNFTMKDIKVTFVFRSSSSSEQNSSLEFWEVALIVGGLLVLTLLVIIILLAIQNRRLKSVVPKSINPWSNMRGLGFANPFTNHRSRSFDVSRPNSLYQVGYKVSSNGTTAKEEPMGLKTFSSQDLTTLE